MRSNSFLSLLSLFVVPSQLFQHSVASSAHQHRANHDAVAKRINTLELREPSDNSTLSKRFGGARMTWFDTGLGNCGWRNTASDYIVALSQAMYAGGSHCGKSLTINYNGRTAQATVADSCVECPYTAIDLTRELFRHFVAPDTPENVGTIHAEWFFNDGNGGGGGGGKPKPPPPKTRTTTTKKQTPTSTTSTTSSKTTTALKTQSSKSSSSTSTPSAIPTGNNLSKLNQAVLNLGELFAAGANAA